MLRPTMLLLLALTVVACQPAADNAEAPPAGTGEVDVTMPEPAAEDARDAVHEFHAALTAGDSARVLELLHSDALIYEAGHAETVEQYRAGHLGADIEYAGEVEREVVAEQIVPLDGAVLYMAETTARGTFRGRDIDVTGVETVVLVPAEDGWRIRHVHWSSR